MGWGGVGGGVGLGGLGYCSITEGGDQKREREKKLPSNSFIATITKCVLNVQKTSRGSRRITLTAYGFRRLMQC